MTRAITYSASKNYSQRHSSSEYNDSLVLYAMFTHPTSFTLIDYY